VAKPELGIKRICPNCGSKYYDLNRDPIICPRCGTQFEATARVRPAAVVSDDEDDVEVDTESKAEFVPLEEADQEEADTGAVTVDGDDDDVEDDDDEADDAFLEPDEDEEGDDVGAIIGDVDDEEA
jgi:uncharacterized protein (TIGR02300 family)